MADERPSGPDTIEAAFVFVPHGDPPPTEWMAQHPGWVKIPATFVPHDAVSRGMAAEETWIADRDPAMDWLGMPVSEGAPAYERRPGRMMRGGIPPDRPGDLGEDPIAVYLRTKEAMDRLEGDPQIFTQNYTDADRSAEYPLDAVGYQGSDDLNAYLARDPVDNIQLNALVIGDFSTVVSWFDPIGTAEAAGTSNSLEPDENATGDHSTFRRAPDGSIHNYQTYEQNPVTGTYDPKLRFRGNGKLHERVAPPLVLERRAGKGVGSTPSVARPALPSEIPGPAPLPPEPSPVAPTPPPTTAPETTPPVTAPPVTAPPVTAPQMEVAPGTSVRGATELKLPDFFWP